MTVDEELRQFLAGLGFDESESGSLITILNACGLVGGAMGSGVALSTLGGPGPKNGIGLVAAVLGFAVGWSSGFIMCRSIKGHVDRHLTSGNLSSGYMPPETLGALRLELRRLLNLYKSNPDRVVHDPALSA